MGRHVRSDVNGCEPLARPLRTAALGFLLVMAGAGAAAEPPVAEARDASWFLRRMRTLEHLPLLEDAHLALASTWDRSGRNADGTDYKRVEGTVNVLLDVDGPGCIHRLFTGGSEPGRPDLPGYLRVDGTRVQVFLDHQTVPVFDAPVVDFFDPDKGPIPSPLAGDKAHGWTYPGLLFPIPYAHHCKIQLLNPAGTNWGSYWQVAYSTYATGKVETLRWPLPPSVRAELDAVRRAWSDATSAARARPGASTLERSAPLASGESLELRLDGAGVVRELRVAVEPATPEVLRTLRLTALWDGAAVPSIDAPVGSFFGHTHSGDAARFSSLLIGVTDGESWSRIPMPYANGARIILKNESASAIARVRVALSAEALGALPRGLGRLHATFHEAAAATSEAPRFGPQSIPGHLVLQHEGRGKYVGVVMSEDWPHEGWWGEGDWLIWTDESDWPPSYHGTGSEEYFNSGWCLFDRKAVSGYVAVHPGHPTQYSFHLNDAFPFRKRIRVAVETVGWDEADRRIHAEHPTWSTTAFWYADGAQAAGSLQQGKLTRRGQ